MSDPYLKFRKYFQILDSWLVNFRILSVSCVGDKTQILSCLTWIAEVGIQFFIPLSTYIMKKFTEVSWSVCRAFRMQNFMVPRVKFRCAILEWLKLQDSKIWLWGHLQWHDLPAKFHENLRNDSKVIMGDMQTAWWSRKSHFRFSRKVR
jgi:hypothetical protein